MYNNNNIIISLKGKNMIEQDTVKLLRECDAGIKMGVSSISDVVDYVKNPDFKKALTNCQTAHEKLKTELQNLLNKCHDDGKNPNPIAKSMSWIKTKADLIINESDATIADLMIDGCNMGIKSLYRYTNQYPAASQEAKDIAMKLAKLEEQLSCDARQYL